MRDLSGNIKRVRIIALVAMAALALLLVACGGGDSSDGDSGGSDEGVDINVDELPGTVIVLEGDRCPPVFAAAGDDITWVNSSAGPLVVRERDAVGGSDFDSGVLEPGESYTYAFSQFGSYGYECSEDGSQKGSITVSQ